MAYSRDFILLEIIFVFIIVGSLAISYNLHLYRLELERAVVGNTATADDYYNEYTRSVFQLVEEVKRDLSRIRHLNFTREIDVVLINTTWAIETWAPKYDGVPEDTIYKEKMYKATLLVPYNFSLVAGQRGWVAMFLAATAGTTLYINTDYFNLQDGGARNVLVHELTHILQHLHFRMEIGRSSADSMMAASALIEGDAGWAQHLYCIDTGLCRPSPTVSMDLSNPYISLLLFPYIYGENFVRRLYTYGGWELVNRAYSKPPISTSMVMKPERYIAYLFNASYVPEDVLISRDFCQYGDPLYIDTLGEYYILLVLAQRVGLDSATRAADGWNGDRIELYRGLDTGYLRWVVCWNTSWSSPEDAGEFYEVFVQALRRETEHVSAHKDVAHARIYTREVEGGWEPGIERAQPSIALTILLSGRYVVIISEISEPAYVCKVCS
ncbi:MAG: hypothetical protein N3D82_01275 [Ignisphaera sp.]|nr:hypothetical protein [Ignisphaera sp.]MCX8167648.1 hypothetical protein [Ignisphaera sp.]MDW8085639.1 hypothetical protein [Ignisphaera sp.]